MATAIRLGDVATYINGYPFKPEDRGTSGLPIIRIQDLTGNTYDLGFYDGEYPSRIEINNGDVLISWSGSLGVYVWNRGKALLNQHIFKVVFDKVVIDKDYFVFAVRHKLREMESKTHGATMKHIVKGDFDSTTIPFPSVENQREIAHLLLAALYIIEARQRQLRTFDTLIKARFVEMFGEPISNSKKLPLKKLGEICDLQAGDFTPADAIHEIPDENNPYPCYGGNGIRGYVDNYTQEGEFPIIGRQGALCGNVQFASGKFRNTEHAVLETPKVSIDRLWLFELLCLEDLYRFHTGAAQPGLAIKILNQVSIPIAPIALQQQYANFFQQVNQTKSAIQASLDKAQLLFDSLMQQYFG